MWSTPSRVLRCASLISLIAACSDETVENLDGLEPVAEVESARACELDWSIDNVVTCVVPPTVKNPPIIYSSHLKAGEPTCDPYSKFPQPVPKANWSKQHVIGLTVGEAKVCFSLKQGDFKNPTSDDCVLNKQCFDVEYTKAETELDLPELTPWSATDEACARAYYADGGYVEMRIESDDLGCAQDGDDVERLPLCPPKCDGKDDKTAGCETCVDRKSVTGAF
jgi:hypothetical protein